MYLRRLLKRRKLESKKMPTYEYHCDGCGKNVDIFHSMTAAPAEVCPNCGAKKLHRLISGGSGIIFKGSGFYCTDYKKSSSTPASTSNTTSSSSDDSSKSSSGTSGSDASKSSESVSKSGTSKSGSSKSSSKTKK